MTQLEVLLLVLGNLNRLGLKYMLTGAYAVSFYGKPRTTHDIDFKIAINYADISKVNDAFKDMFYVDEVMIKEAIRHQQMFNIIHNETQTKVDFWIVTDTEFDQERFKRRLKINILNTQAFISTAEDLILIKLKWYEESDLQKHYEDAKGIFEIQSSLDIPYIKKWSKKLSIENFVENIVKKI